MLPKQLKDSQRHQRQPKQVELFLQSAAAAASVQSGGRMKKEHTWGLRHNTSQAPTAAVVVVVVVMVLPVLVLLVRVVVG